MNLVNTWPVPISRCSALLSARSFLCFLVWYLCTPYTMDAVLRPFLRSFSPSLLPIHLFLSSSISHSSWRCCCFVSFSQAIRIRAFSRNQFPAVSIQFLVYIYIYIHTLGAMCIIYTHMQDICNNFSFLVHTLHECSTISLTHGNLPTTYSPFVHSVCFSLEIFFFFFSPRFRGKEKTIEGRFDVGPGVNIVRYEIKQDERRFSLSEKRARLDRNNFLPQRKSKGARLDRK